MTMREIVDDCGHGFELGIELCPECRRNDQREALAELMRVTHELGAYEDCPTCVATGGHTDPA